MSKYLAPSRPRGRSQGVPSVGPEPGSALAVKVLSLSISAFQISKKHTDIYQVSIKED